MSSSTVGRDAIIQARMDGRWNRVCKRPDKADGKEVSSIMSTLNNWQCLLGAPRTESRCQDGSTRLLDGEEELDGEQLPRDTTVPKNSKQALRKKTSTGASALGNSWRIKS